MYQEQPKLSSPLRYRKDTQFALLYPELLITTQAVSQLPWGHIVRLMQMIKDDVQREWYAAQTIKNGWSRSVLEMQIESDLYARQSISNKKTTNFHEQLPEEQSDLATEILKDPYNFDFLTIQGKTPLLLFMQLLIIVLLLFNRINYYKERYETICNRYVACHPIIY